MACFVEHEEAANVSIPKKKMIFLKISCSEKCTCVGASF